MDSDCGRASWEMIGKISLALSGTLTLVITVPAYIGSVDVCVGVSLTKGLAIE